MRKPRFQPFSYLCWAAAFFFLSMAYYVSAPIHPMRQHSTDPLPPAQSHDHLMHYLAFIGFIALVLPAALRVWDAVVDGGYPDD